MLLNVLRRQRVVPIDLDSAPPGTVTTVGVVYRPDLPEGRIVRLVRRGYLWQGEVLRKPEVVVATSDASIADTEA
jgi:molecular chaperone GrpE (heat shock protein)